MKLPSSSIFLLPLAMTSMASAAIIVDFTSTGSNNTVNGGGFVFSSQDLNGTGVSFTVTAAAVIPPGGGAFGGGITRLNGGLGAEVENDGDFLNVIGGVSEVLEFTISGVTGLQAGESLVVTALLSQNSNSTAANQSGGYGGAFGQNGNDDVTLTSDSAASVGIPQSDAGNLGSILLNANNGNNTDTGNTFAHSAVNLGFTNSFTLAQTDLTRNDAIVIQGFEFAVVPEPSTSLLALGSLSLLLIRKRRP